MKPEDWAGINICSAQILLLVDLSYCGIIIDSSLNTRR